jgi:hypothetical protein
MAKGSSGVSRGANKTGAKGARATKTQKGGNSIGLSGTKPINHHVKYYAGGKK